MRTLLALVLVAASAVACQPSTTFNRGVHTSFHPSGKADAQERIVPSAIELRADADQAVVKEAGGVYLGELEVVGEKAGALFMSKQGGGNLSGRISLEAATKGATHFYLASSTVENGVETTYTSRGNTSQTPTSTTRARFVLFRVEATDWQRLPPPYRPEAPPTVKASPPAPAPATAPATSL